MNKYVVFDRDDTICAQPSGTLNPDFKYTYFVHPQIEQFLKAIKEDDYSLVMASGGTPEGMQKLNKKLGVDKYFEFSHLFGSQFAQCGGKKLQLLKKYLPEGFMDNSVMIGNNNDIYSVIASIPIFVVYCGMYGKQTEYWDVKQVYHVIQKLFNQGKLPAQNFDEIFAQGKQLEDDFLERSGFGKYTIKKASVTINDCIFTFEHRFPDKNVVEEMKRIEKGNKFELIDTYEKRVIQVPTKTEIIELKLV